MNMLNRLNREIATSQRKIRAGIRRVENILDRNAPELGAKFKLKMRRHGLSAWDWGKFTSDILGTAADLKVSKELSKQNEREAQLELAKIQEQTAQMQKQLEMQREMTKLTELQAKLPKFSEVKETATKAVQQNKGPLLAVAGGLLALLAMRGAG